MTEFPTSSSSRPARTFWQRRVVDPVIAQLTQGVTPEKMALALAIGSACALCPILGTATVLCLIAGIALRLNQVALQVVNLLFTPIHVPMIYCYLWLGRLIFGVHTARMSVGFMRDLLWSNPGEFFARFGRAAFHAIVAWFIFVLVWSPLVYGVALPVLREILRRRTVAAEKAAEDASEHPVP